MRQWVTGVTIVTAQSAAPGQPRGMTANSFASISLEPPLVGVCLLKTTETAAAVVAMGAFGVSLLKADQEYLSARFAGYDPNFPADLDRFTGVSTHQAVTGAPLLSEALGWLDCRVWAIYDGSTHHIVVGEVVAVSAAAPDLLQTPLVYYNRHYRQLAPPQQG
jgi:flavin reductase (DIM6/NTAB) family NADH-FMN oxidoreductase RutF